MNTLEQYWRLKTVSFKYGALIRDFTWESCKLTKAEIVTLLHFMPTIESFKLVSWKLQQELYDEPTSMLSFERLTKLEIVKCDQSTIEFIANALPVNILEKLNVQGDPLNLLRKQQTITDLELNVDAFDPDELHNLKLLQLTLKLRRYRDSQDRSIIQNIVANQPNLAALDLIHCEGCFDGDDGAFSAVCNLSKLKSLKVNIDDISASAFMEHFTKLCNLRILELESVEHNFAPVVTVIDELSRQEMPHLENLRLYLSDVGVPLDRILRMGKNFKALKSFTLHCDHPLTLDCYLANMMHLEDLSIDYHYSKEFSKLYNNSDLKFNNLRNLTLQGFGFGSDDVNWNEITLLKLSEAMPNLEKLELDAAFPFNTAFIFKIMEKLRRLQTLKNWSMVQSGENYIKFDQQSVFDLRGIAGMMKEFSLELRLKTIDMDVSRVKEEFSKEFDVAITRVGNFIVIRMGKK